MPRGRPDGRAAPPGAPGPPPDVGTPVATPGLAGAARRRFSVVVLGDVRIEVRATLRGVRFAEVSADRLAYAPASAVVGGTAVNMARCAVEYFRRVAVLGRIGDDDFTPVVRRELRRIGARDLLRAEPGTANGVTVMLRDLAPGGGRGARLLIAEHDAPDRRLSPSDVRDAVRPIRRADALCCDGYASLAAASRAALRTAMEAARAAGTLVLFDLVPHDVDGRLPPEEALAPLALADIVTSEAPTLARLLGRPGPRTADDTLALVPALDALVPGRPLWLLRFGPSSLEGVLAHRRGDLTLHYASGYAEGVERIGFGDRLAAAELYWWLARRAAGAR
ncbi:carbohydrate kinase family protein [Actinomadura rupiterrae]|uniref:carbohydrate kinase family protein n=1 Tax=Actinomadura rupiterrae TaxID=559627 RepID=UPI002646739A|nr:carbohydrate kinase family protein [Actinomadura rupiterrae]MCP2340838.1 sugar/nucleoside kinase (ribokinase family) [Actinomadura rupiterrae]